MSIQITFLGTSHGDPCMKRHCSSTYYCFGDYPLLVDAGEPVMALLVRQHIQTASLKTILLTHMHEDHVGGLTGICKQTQKYPIPGNRTAIWFPEKNIVQPFTAWLDAIHCPDMGEFFDFETMEPDKRLTLGKVKVRSIPTDHMKAYHVPSYAYLFEFEGKRILHTGDLSADFHDFPLLPDAGDIDLCICEATHASPAKMIPLLEKANLKRLIFNHISPLWCDEPDSKFRNDFKDLPCPFEIACDGMQIHL